jgi:hypothetical protein
MLKLKTKRLRIFAACVLSLTVCLLPSASNNSAAHPSMRSELMVPKERGEQGNPPAPPEAASPETFASKGDSSALGGKLLVSHPNHCFYPSGTGDTPWFGGFGGGVASWQQNNTFGVPGTCAAFYGARIVLQGNSAGWLGSGNGFDWRVVTVALAWYRPSQPDLLFRSGNFHGWTQAGGTNRYEEDYGWKYCPTGAVIVGVRGHADNYVNSIGFACKHLQTGAITFLPEAGSNYGPRYEFGCDWNRGILWNDLLPGSARTGLILDGISFYCRRPLDNTVFWLRSRLRRR